MISEHNKRGRHMPIALPTVIPRRSPGEIQEVETHAELLSGPPATNHEDIVHGEPLHCTMTSRSLPPARDHTLP